MRRKTLLLIGLALTLISCDSDSSSDDAAEVAPSDTETTEPAEGLSAGFGVAGCTAAACHGSDGRRDNASLHDPSGNPVTNLSTSERNLASWTDWVRDTAKSPMPRYTEEEYSTSDLEAEYRHLTVRNE